MAGKIYPPPRRLDKRQGLFSAISSAVEGGGATTAATTASSTTTTTTTTLAPTTTTTTVAPTTTSVAPTTTSDTSSAAAASSSAAAAASSSSQQSSLASFSSSSASAASASRTTVVQSSSVSVSVVEVTVTNSNGQTTVSSSATSITSAATDAASNANHSSGLSSGARTGIIVGCVVGGAALIALLIAACLLIRRKRRSDLDAKDQIRWPELAATAEDRAALYPETTHRTGRAGVGEDGDGDMEQIDAASAYSGPGVAGVGAAGRYPSMSTSNGRQPTLPQIAPSIYSDEGGYGQVYPPSQSHYSQQSHAPTYMTHQNGALAAAPGPASIDYYARQGQTPSPPRTYAEESSSGHEAPMNGGMGSDPYALDEPIERAASPTPMQVGGAFGTGYDESEGGKRWRLSVVNDDAHRD